MKIRARSANNIVHRAFQKLNLVAPDESISTQELTQGAYILFELMDRWNAEQLVIPAVRERSLSLTEGANEYEWGNGWGSHSLPIDYLGAYITDTDGTHIRINIRGASSRLDQGNDYDGDFGNVWIERGGKYDVHKFDFTPSSGYTITYLVKEPFTASRDDLDTYVEDCTATTESFDWPAWDIGGNACMYVEHGYVSALIFNLAVDLMSEYPLELNSTQTQIITGRASNLYNTLKDNAIEVQIRQPATIYSGRVATSTGDCNQGWEAENW